jgi:hypothetical protein
MSAVKRRADNTVQTPSIKRRKKDGTEDEIIESWDYTCSFCEKDVITPPDECRLPDGSLLSQLHKTWTCGGTSNPLVMNSCLQRESLAHKLCFNCWNNAVLQWWCGNQHALRQHCIVCCCINNDFRARRDLVASPPSATSTVSSSSSVQLISDPEDHGDWIIVQRCDVDHSGGGIWVPEAYHKPSGLFAESPGAGTPPAEILLKLRELEQGQIAQPVFDEGADPGAGSGPQLKF